MSQTEVVPTQHTSLINTDTNNHHYSSTVSSPHSSASSLRLSQLSPLQIASKESKSKSDPNKSTVSKSASSSSLRARTKSRRHSSFSSITHHNKTRSPPVATEFTGVEESSFSELSNHRRSRSLVRSRYRDSTAALNNSESSLISRPSLTPSHTPSDRTRTIQVRTDFSRLFYGGDISNTPVDCDDDTAELNRSFPYSERSPLLLASDSQLNRTSISSSSNNTSTNSQSSGSETDPPNYSGTISHYQSQTKKQYRSPSKAKMAATQKPQQQKVSPYRTFGSDGNSSPLTGSPIQRVWDSFSQSMRNLNPPAGSLRASTLTVVTGMVGGGTLTLSLAVKKSGLIFGFFYIVLIGLLSGYSALVLVFCAERNNCPSFRSLAKKLYGSQTAKGIQFMLLLMLWSASVSYMTLVKTLLTDAMHISFGSSFWDDQTMLLIFCVCVIVMPLALMRKVSALRYASMAGLAALSFTVCVVIGIFFTWCDGVTCHTEDGHQDCEEDRRCFIGSIKHLELLNTHWLGHPYSIAVILGGFAAHPTVLPIYFEMQRRSSVRMRRCLIYGFIFTIVMYTLIAYFGYFTFPNHVEANLLSSDYRHNPVMLVSATFLCLYVISVCPLFAHAFRKSLSELLLENQNSQNTRKQIHVHASINGKDLSADASNSSINGAIITEEFKDVVEDPASHFAFVPTLTPRTRNVFDRAALREAEKKQAAVQNQKQQQRRRNSSKRSRSNSNPHHKNHHDNGNNHNNGGIKVVRASDNINEPLMNSLRKTSVGTSMSSATSATDPNFSFVGVDAETGKPFGKNVEKDDDDSSMSSHSSFDNDLYDTMEFNNDPMLGDSNLSGANSGNDNPNELSMVTHTIVTVGFIFSAMGVALVASNIGVVNSLIGSTTLPVCCFFFPAAVSWRTEEATNTMRIVTTVTSIVVLINSLLTLYTTFD